MKKYQGVIPAFYAAYDANGNVCEATTKQFTNYLISTGIKGLYVGGSSGECIYQSVADRKKTLEYVMSEAKGKITIIAHVACNNTSDSMELAAHAESLGVDAIAAIPPIYFKLPEHAIASYWNDISSAAPNTDFIIYNIPQLAGVSLTMSLLNEMIKNPRVIGVKNSSMPVQDIQMFKDVKKDFMVFNGPDEQFIAGLSMGADGGIGGTYAVMPTLFLKMEQLVKKGDMANALMVQNDVCRIIYKMVTTKGNLYAVMKEIIKIQKGIDLGGVRKPLANLVESDMAIVTEASNMIIEAVKKYENL